MGIWSLLAIRNWRARPGRTAGVIVAVALGVGIVVWVTCSYESVRLSISESIVDRWVGRTHLAVESPMGHWGDISQDMVDVVRGIDGVTAVAPRLRRRMNHLTDDGRSREVDVIGIDPASEYVFRTHDVTGRAIAPGDAGVAVIESEMGERAGIGIGDRVVIEAFTFGPVVTFEVIGMYVARRVASFQRPMVYVTLGDLQGIGDDAGRITVVDAMLADPAPANLERAADELRGIIGQRRAGYQVTTSTARLNQLREAQSLTELALMMVSGVALLTAFFIIMTTQMCGMAERVRQLGMLRCVGGTRLQLVSLVLTEVAPLGTIGVVLGIPVGLGFARLGSWLAPHDMPGLVLSGRGIAFAVIGGALTTIGSAFVPAVQAARCSPMDATRPQARPDRRWLPALAAVAGIAMVLAHTWMVRTLPPVRWIAPDVAVGGTALLYIGYALMTPLAVQLGGRPAVQLVGRLLAVRPALLNDQVGRAAWRGAGICCGLMVGLSLLITVACDSASVRAGWDFPKRLAEAFVWTRSPAPGSYAQFARSVPGIAECTVVSEIACDVGEKKTGFFDMLKLRSTFVAGEPERFLTMTKLEFLEGNFEDAYEKTRSGGYILVPPEASRAFNLHLGDRVPITAAGRTAVFEVAGVVQSPALDIAVTYFQADSYMMVAAAGSVLGSLEDAKKHFGIDEMSLLLMNFQLPEGQTPALFEAEVPPDVTQELVARSLLEVGERLTNDPEELDLLRPRLADWLDEPTERFDTPELLAPYVNALAHVAAQWDELEPRGRWRLYFDQLVMRQVIRTIDRPHAIFGSLRELKERIDRDIRQATLLLATIPVVALIVAALGVGNLMTANVISRSREIGLLRSAGATRWQIMRLVLGEAIILGAIGSVAGIALGVHAADSDQTLVARAIGFAPDFVIPWSDVAIGVAITVTVCIIAGLSPARRAARSNVIDAMRTA